MVWFKPGNELQRAVLAAIDRSHAMIEFSVDGKVLTANENFARVMGYPVAEVKGLHHSLFLSDKDRESAEYRDFWARLKAGQFVEGQVQRVTKAGTPVWLQATYNPILNAAGKPTRIVKIASDITAQKVREIEAASRIAAVDRSQAVIEFDLEGHVLEANANFLACMGYDIAEIRGKHHSLFVDPAERDTAAYRDFWAGLRRSEFKQALFRRVGKGGREVWIQATYIPLLGADGRPTRVVKFATEVTEQVRANQMMAEIVGRTREVVGAAKANDLTRRVSLDGISGEIRDLATGVNDLIDTVSGVIGAVHDASAATLGAARRISEGANDLAARTEQQASALEHTAATTDQLAGSVKLSAQASRQGVEIADEAQRKAETGGGIVRETVEAMSRIEEASKRITDISGVIDEIAFQTNLLALNAAVEAARAGDAGKGFAVVASEVRTLAQRSSAAAKDITSLINSSTTEVETGVRLVRSAGEVLGQMVDASRRVSSTIAEISTVTSGQARGIDEMSQAVARMDQITQQNASLAEQSAASADALSAQIGDLHRYLSEYRTQASQKASGRGTAEASTAETRPRRARAG